MLPAIGASGDRVVGSPAKNYSAGVEYGFDLTERWAGWARAGWAYVGSLKSELSSLPIESYDTVNVRFGLVQDNLSIELFGRNITDEQGVTRIEPLAFGGDYVLIRPREVGIEVRYRTTNPIGEPVSIVIVRDGDRTGNAAGPESSRSWQESRKISRGPRAHEICGRRSFTFQRVPRKCSRRYARFLINSEIVIVAELLCATGSLTPSIERPDYASSEPRFVSSISWITREEATGLSRRARRATVQTQAAVRSNGRRFSSSSCRAPGWS